MYLILLAYMAVAAFCLAFVDTLGPAKDVIVVAAFIATAVGIWRSEPDRSEVSRASVVPRRAQPEMPPG